MRKERKAQLATILILAAALGAAAWRKGVPRFPGSGALPAVMTKTDPTPQDAVYAMLDAARDGKVADYLAAHTGQMRASLDQAVAEQGRDAFARYLKESNAAIKGVALEPPQPLTDREVKVRVEYIFADRNEVQFLYLEKDGNRWRIARVDSAERIKTLVPYGTPVQ